MTEQKWVVYIIYNKNFSYVGATPDYIKRIKKHNQEISGGAKYTRSKGPGWKYICIIEGFKNKIDALMFEWSLKHCAPKKEKGKYNRILKLERVLNKEKWTQKSPSAINYNLKVIWHEPSFLFKELDLPDYIEMDIY